MQTAVPLVSKVYDNRGRLFVLVLRRQECDHHQPCGVHAAQAAQRSAVEKAVDTWSIDVTTWHVKICRTVR